MKLTNSQLKEIIKEELQRFNESTVRISTMKDASFSPGMVQLLGKKGTVGLDRKSVSALVKLVRSGMKGTGMGRSFTAHEGILKEFNKSHFLNLIRQEIESLKGQIAYCKDGLRQPDLKKWIKKELEAVLKDKIKDLKDTGKHYKRVQNLKEGKLSEGSTHRLPNGVKVNIDFKGLTLQGKGKPVFLDRREMMVFFKATSKYLK